MDTNLVFTMYFMIYGIVVLSSVAHSKERGTFPSYIPKYHKIGSSVRNARQPFHWKRLFPSLFPLVKGSKNHERISRKFYSKSIRHMNHNEDLLQDSPDLLETFVCPDGYRKRLAGDVEFCSPTKTEHEITKDKTQCTGSRCKVAEHKTEPNTCPDGSERIVTQEQMKCVDKASMAGIRCLKGTRLLNTDSGWKCDPVPVSEQPPVRQHQFEGLKSAPKGKKQATGIPTCEDGKVAAMSQDGYICIDPVFPASVCPENKVPSMSSRGIQCIPCPRGQKVIRAENGVKCSTDETSSLTEIPCAEGLQPVQTPVGRICQYIPSSDAIPATKCPEGQQIKIEDGQMICIQEKTCQSGYITAESENGEIQCIEPTLTDESSCLEGETYFEGACISALLAQKIHADSSIPCNSGHFLVVSNSGSVCKPATDEYAIEIQNHMSCRLGTIVTQTSAGFRCLEGVLPFYVIPMCERGYVIARLGEVYECISMYDADLICSVDMQMVRVDGGFVCKKAVHEDYCRSGFYHTDQDGRIKCLSQLEASEMCGDGYLAIRKDKSFLCKRLVEDVSCPAGFIFSMDHGEPLCKQMGVECYDLSKVTQVGCTTKVPFCHLGYKINLGLDIPRCELERNTRFEEPAIIDTEEPVITGSKEPVITDAELQPCNADGSVRPCDLPAKLLLSGCNPDCANGGNCVNGSCFCPPGVTGHACHIDVDECRSRPCEFRCENTFGGYQCACPDGMFLSTDGRTCTDAGCIPECLNNGECVRGQCRCESGFEGLYCQIDKDECLMYGERLCQHQCRNTHGGYTCICPPGSRLNQDKRTCLNTTCIPECRNGGTCLNHRCHCPTGFYGIICQFDVNECRKDKPCHHKCENSWGSYRCTCKEGFMLDTDGRTCIQR